MPKASGTEFRFNQSDFRFIADFIGTRTGIVLGDVKRDLVYGRLAKRIRQLGLSSFSEYCDLLASDQDEEIEYWVYSVDGTERPDCRPLAGDLQVLVSEGKVVGYDPEYELRVSVRTDVDQMRFRRSVGADRPTAEMSF